MTIPPSADWIPDFLGKTLDDAQLRLVEVLGEGAYGVVFRAVDVSSNPTASSSSSSSAAPKEFAVKIMEKADPDSRRWRYQLREVNAHMRVSNHPHVVTVHGVFECEYFIYLVLDLCEGGDLFNPMMERHAYCGNDPLVKRVFCQLLDAVEYCHEHGVYHRDLKPDNILTNADGTEVMIADFGLSTRAKVSDTFCCGSQNYMSPECIGEDYDYHPYSTGAADVWSLGIILTNLIAGRNPWNQASLNDKSYLQYLTNPTYLRDMLPISLEAADLLQAVLTIDPGARLSIPDLRERVLAVKTFFMSPEEIIRGSTFVRMAAAAYAPLQPQSDSLFGDADAAAVLQEQSSSVSKQPSAVKANFVICSSSGVSSDNSSSGSSESGDESEGPITPETHAQDAAKLAEVPEFGESEKIGAAAVSSIRKGRSLPSENSTALVVNIAVS